MKPEDYEKMYSRRGKGGNIKLPQWKIDARASNPDWESRQPVYVAFGQGHKSHSRIKPLKFKM